MRMSLEEKNRLVGLAGYGDYGTALVALSELPFEMVALKVDGLLRERGVSGVDKSTAYSLLTTMFRKSLEEGFIDDEVSG